MVEICLWQIFSNESGAAKRIVVLLALYSLLFAISIEKWAQKIQDCESWQVIHLLCINPRGPVSTNMHLNIGKTEPYRACSEDGSSAWLYFVFVIMVWEIDWAMTKANLMMEVGSKDWWLKCFIVCASFGIAGMLVTICSVAVTDDFMVIFSSVT